MIASGAEPIMEGIGCAFFALDIYDWKDLGKMDYLPACGCAGFYVLPSGMLPPGATAAANPSIIAPTSDPFDAFSS